MANVAYPREVEHERRPSEDELSRRESIGKEGDLLRIVPAQCEAFVIVVS